MTKYSNKELLVLEAVVEEFRTVITMANPKSTSQYENDHYKWLNGQLDKIISILREHKSEGEEAEVH